MAIRNGKNGYDYGYDEAGEGGSESPGDDRDGPPSGGNGEYYLIG